MEVTESSHLRIKNAGVWLYNADGLIERLQRKIISNTVGHYGGYFKPEILRMEFCDKIVRKTLLLACWDLHIVSRGGQVADNTAALRVQCCRPEHSANELDDDWFRFLIDKGDDSLGGLPIDKFDAKELRAREGGAHRNGEGWTLQFVLYDIVFRELLVIIRRFDYGAQ